MSKTYITIDEFAACVDGKFLVGILADVKIEAGDPLSDPVEFSCNGQHYTVDLHTFSRCTVAIRPKPKAA